MATAFETTVDETTVLAQLQSRCRESVSVEACYQRLADQGVTYGDRFRAIKKIWKGNSEVLSRLQLPEVLHSTAAAYQLHPVLLDACLQSLAAVFLDHPETETYLPGQHFPGSFRIHAWIWRRPTTRFGAMPRCSPQIEEPPPIFRFSLKMGDSSAALKELRLRPRNARASIRFNPSFKTWLYQIDWQAQPLPNAATHR